MMECCALNKRASLFLFAVAFVFGCAPRGPLETAETLVSDLQAEGDNHAVLKYVHWEQAYQNLTPAERFKLGVKSSAELETVMTERLRDPEQSALSALEARIETLPPEEHAHRRKALAALNARVAKEKDTTAIPVDYSLGEKQQISENRAEFELVTTKDGSRHSAPLVLERIDGRWHITELRVVRKH